MLHAIVFGDHLVLLHCPTSSLMKPHRGVACLKWSLDAGAGRVLSAWIPRKPRESHASWRTLTVDRGFVGQQSAEESSQAGYTLTSALQALAWTTTRRHPMDSLGISTSRPPEVWPLFGSRTQPDLHPHLNEGSNPFHGIVTGMCTAMRRGDCCLLKWKDVDSKEGFITVKTTKTGETVDSPMFPMLREELGGLAWDWIGCERLASRRAPEPVKHDGQNDVHTRWRRTWRTRYQRHGGSSVRLIGMKSQMG